MVGMGFFSKYDQVVKKKEPSLIDFANCFVNGNNDIETFRRENENEDDAKLRLLLTFATEEKSLRDFTLYLMGMGVLGETAEQYAKDLKQIFKDRFGS